MSRLETERALSPLERAAQWLREAERPLCLAGRGVQRARATESLARLCASLPKLRVASTPGAKGVLSEDHPQAVGVAGFGGHLTAEVALSEADAVLVLGTRLFEQSAGFHARLRGERVIRADLDPARARSGPADALGLEGDLQSTLHGLTQLLGSPPRSALPRATGRAIPRFDFTEAPSGARDRLVLPQALFTVLSRVASDVPIAADAGLALPWSIEWLERSTPNDLQLSLDWGSMGFALPAAIGVSLARGKKPAICVTGDGAMLMAGGELHTAVEQELPVIVIVLNDAGAGMVRSGSSILYGPEQVPTPDYRYRVNFCAFARALGAHGELIGDCEQFAERLAFALRRETPTLFDVQVDPSEVPRAVRERALSMWQRGGS